MFPIRLSLLHFRTTLHPPFGRTQAFLLRPRYRLSIPRLLRDPTLPLFRFDDSLDVSMGEYTLVIYLEAQGRLFRHIHLVILQV